ncbi:50S ribosomal protein L9 [Armatimonadota bacterium]|nr:50S ribosomal protein L9 [Armatimonadota bacterium]
MKIVLTRDVPQLGRDGDIVTVADGYARNYLFPRHLAVVAKASALKQQVERVAREKQKVAEQLSAAQANATSIQDKQFQVIGKAAVHSTRLYGSVTEADIAEVIKTTTGIEVDKRRISHIDPIKVTGLFSLTLRLHPDVVVPFTVEVVTQEQLEVRAREAAKAAEDVAAKEAAAAVALEAQAAVAAQA